MGLESDEPVPDGEALIEALRALDDGRVVAGGVEAARAALETVRAEKALARNAATSASSETVADVKALSARASRLTRCAASPWPARTSLRSA